MKEVKSQQQVVLITGPAGAGRSTAIHALEDLGFEAIDNLPLSLLERLFAAGAHDRPLAVGVDARTRDFGADVLMKAVAKLRDNTELAVSLVFIDCSTDTLLRRFSETRRRHPLSPNDAPLKGIEAELGMLAPVRDLADVLIDTSALSPHDLRREMSALFGESGAQGLSIQVQSFSFKRGTPRSADMVLDCRFLRNPHWEPELRPLTGQTKDVQDHVQGDPLYAPFMEKTTDLLRFLLPACKAEGKSYFTLALGCTGGKHRSVCVAEDIANRLAQADWQVSIRHRELERAHSAMATLGVVKS